MGASPPSNSYLSIEMLREPEKWYPLRVLICDQCWLAQTEDFVGAGEMFSDDYAYFSSFSESWLKHAEKYVSKMTEQFSLNDESMVVEIAANDGYLLQYVKQRHIPCYGIEPTHNTAKAAREKGIEIIERFFDTELANELAANNKKADLIAANNVLAHVPDINDFVKGFTILLKPQGVVTFEFPHLLNLIELNQFDTIYHEHYSYLSLTAVQSILKAADLMVFDVEELSTHGGSLRVYAQHRISGKHLLSTAVDALIDKERSTGLTNLDYYRSFQDAAENIKLRLLEFLMRARKDNKTVAAYGAAAKGNTLLNFAGVKDDLIQYVVDRNPAKQGKFMPGSRIPIMTESYMKNDKPDLILILPWNLNKEIMTQLAYIQQWGGEFVSLADGVCEIVTTR